MSGDLFVAVAADHARPRKVARPDLNLANLVGLALAPLLRSYPELLDDELWITGSRVWRVVLGEAAWPQADVDVFATSTAALERLVGNLRGMRGIDMAERAQGGSHDRGVGYRTRGASRDGEEWRPSFDAWHETSDVYAQLDLYPPAYSHCRAAYSPTRRVLVVKVNEQ